MAHLKETLTSLDGQAPARTMVSAPLLISVIIPESSKTGVLPLITKAPGAL